MTVSLKSRVRAISRFLSLTGLIQGPLLLGRFDILLLAFLYPATQEDNYLHADFAEIHPVARAKIDLAFRDPTAEALRV